MRVSLVYLPVFLLFFLTMFVVRRHHARNCCEVLSHDCANMASVVPPLSVILVLVCSLPDTNHLLCRSTGTHCTRKTLSLTLSCFRIIRRVRLPFENTLKILSALLRQRRAVSLVGSCASSTVDTVLATVFGGSRSWFEGRYMCISRSPRIRQSLFPGLTVMHVHTSVPAGPSDVPVSRCEYRELTLRVVMAVVMVTRLAQANYFCCSLSEGPGARVFVAEGDSFCVLCIEGVQMVAIETLTTQTSIFVSSTGNSNIIVCPPEDVNVNFLNPERAECFPRCFFQHAGRASRDVSVVMLQNAFAQGSTTIFCDTRTAL